MKKKRETKYSVSKLNLYKKHIISENNIKFLKLLSSGKFMVGRVSELQLKELRKQGIIGEPSYTLRKLEKMGVVVGYVPLLSEEGKRVIAGLEAMWRLQSGDKTSDIPVEDPLDDFR